MSISTEADLLKAAEHSLSDAVHNCGICGLPEDCHSHHQPTIAHRTHSFRTQSYGQLNHVDSKLLIRLLNELAELRQPQREAILLRALRDLCQCQSRSTPTCWATAQRIPHHTDCPMFPFELPPPTATAAFAAATRQLVDLSSRKD